MSSGTLQPVLTDEQVARFHRDGYLLVENVLTPEETDRYRRAVLGLLPGDLTLPAHWSVHNGRIKPLHPDGNDRFDIPELIPLMGNETLYRVMAQLFGTPRLRVFDGSVGITVRNDGLADQVLSQHLHLDASVPADTDFLFTPQEVQLGGCFYLTDVEPRGGGIHVVPRGHTIVREEVEAARAAGGDGRALHDGWRRITHLDSVEVTGPAGSFALLHHLMPHGASHNRRPTSRVAQFTRYVQIPHPHGADAPPPPGHWDAAGLAAMTPLTRRLFGLDPWPAPAP
ncbi:phytanoyl-CoA dioxygenase family protein [Streptomyces johnsoniae]|uniref:Phytanoyl-CoA dioxygenase family protein n=1 Tax=Streptomyces johnsoniae TaxID=3075532 RepID=A0ABU2RZZ8_9ACTN|nr:phytanoyl-CoA dioxygenase family protein [Streptomyces sp. DSM 41886]MDT0442222.1 phytanoyl-CoA dioxygenase family protein [Streptomyces sp. DSM 41886]